MNTNNNNNSQSYGIDKFEGSFDKEELGVTIIPNKSINDIRCAEALGVYVYLLARPKGWKLNVKQLRQHFLCGQDKMYRILKYLLQENFITCIQIRNKGRFTKPHYRVHLLRSIESNKSVEIISPAMPDLEEYEEYKEIDHPPQPENTDAAIPVTVIKDTYKTKNIENKEVLLNPIVDSSNTTKSDKDYKNNLLFMKFYKIYPNKQKPFLAMKAFMKHKPDEAFVEKIVKDVQLRIENNWKGRDKSKIPFPATYLNTWEWEGEIYENTNSYTNKKNIDNQDMNYSLGDRSEFGF